MKKDNSQPASLVLATLALAVGITGCNLSIAQTGAFTGTISSTLPKESIGVEIIIDDIQKEEIAIDNTDTKIELEPTFEPIISNPPLKSLEEKEENNDNIVYSDLSSYCKYLDSFEPLTNLIDILLLPYDYSKDEQVLAAYQNLKNCGLSITDVLMELDNILVYSQYPTCCDAETFEKLVGTLHKTLNYQANPFSSYHSLAQKVHEFSCSLEHTDEYGIYTCEDLMLRAESIRPLTIEEYLDKNIADNYGYQKIKKDLMLHPDYYIEDYLMELENLVRTQLISTEMDEESWHILFGKLLATLDESESLYETYIDLAVYVHNTLYPDDFLIQDEYGIYISESLKYKKA